MKKSISIALVFVLLIALLVSGTALAQEPEATEEVAAQEATAEPTEEATAEPTEEVTAEPTEEATAEPTEEATAEPTEEATAEPTEEATAEPTEEATAEPTEEATAEPTEEVLVESQDAGEIGASAITGSWSTQYIYVQNLGTSSSGNDVTLTLYNTSGVSTNLPSKNVPLAGAVSFDISSISTGQYSGVAAGSESAALAIVNTNIIGKVGDMYSGFPNPTQNQIVPIIYRDHSYWKSKFYIQNATGTAQNITINAYLKGEPTPRATPSYNVPAYSSREVDFMSSAFNAFGSGFGSFGYAEVVGASGAVAVISSAQKDQAGFPIEALVSGVDSGQAAQEVILPLVYKNHSIWISGISVVNLSGVNTTIDYTYSIAPQYGGGTRTFSRPLAANGADGFSLAIISNVPNSFGSLKLRARDAGAEIVAIANHSKYQTGVAVGSINPSIDPLQATNKVAIPMAEYKSGLTVGDVPGTGLGWQTGLVVYNVGHSGNITTKWVKVNTNPTGSGNTTTYTTGGTSNGITNLTVVSPALKDVIPKGFQGVVYIESTGPIIAIANQTLYSSSMSGIIPGQNY